LTDNPADHLTARTVQPYTPMDTVLSSAQTELVAAERRLVLEIRDALGRTDAAPADVDRVGALLHEMDELFLLVVVGEYNTGKSTFINALLGDDVFEVGDLPTTRAISILRFGEAGKPQPVGDHTRVFRYPLDFLRELEIVDTPGTNSIDRMEEEITRGFVPRADLILFVTSLLQPLTASELDFLGHIRDWGKKVIFVVNGADRRNSEEQLGRVREYLQREVQNRLGTPAPTIYMVSSLEALRAKKAAGARGAAGTSTALAGLDPLNEYPALETYIVETLRQSERIRLKLLSPLGVVRHVVATNLGSLEERLEVVREDGRVLGSISDQLDRYVTDMRADAQRYLADVKNILYEIERRGQKWFDQTIRVGNIGLLRNKDAVENRFRNEVVADGPQQVEEVVHRMVDWLVRNNMKLWNAAFTEVQAHTERLRQKGALATPGSTEFNYNREEMFARLRAPVENRLGQFDAEREAEDIVAAVKESLAQTFGVNVLALGLGAVLVAIFTTAALDLSGILTATLLAVAGWLILPARRKKLMRQLETTIAKLNDDLATLLSTNFEEQLRVYERQMLEVIEPYERFLETERGKVERGITELRALDVKVVALESRIDEMFPAASEPARV
jgi:small GTP-binding protein